MSVSSCIHDEPEPSLDPQEVYLPPVPLSPALRRIHLHLVARADDSLKPEPEREPELATEEPMLVSWDHANEYEKHQLVTLAYGLWSKLSIEQKHQLVFHLVGWHNEPLANVLKRSCKDIFHKERFAEVLYFRLSQVCGFEPVPETGVALLDPSMRAMHYLTLSAVEMTDDVCFAYVFSYHPDLGELAKTPEPETGPLPLVSFAKPERLLVPLS